MASVDKLLSSDSVAFQEVSVTRNKKYEKIYMHNCL